MVFGVERVIVEKLGIRKLVLKYRLGFKRIRFMYFREVKLKAMFEI